MTTTMVGERAQEHARPHRRLPRGGPRGHRRSRPLRLVSADRGRRHDHRRPRRRRHRTGAVAHAKLLVRHGYGVLLHDARGRGKSQGVQNSYGWGWPKDVAGAIRFLKARDEVDPERIGALGLSTGADILVQVAG